MDFIPHINIADFDYDLPLGRIAQFPLLKRDESKLLIYKDGNISESLFKQIVDFLPVQSLMISNETRVIQARILFKRDSGANVELFCLEPWSPSRELQQAFNHQSGVIWKCFVGNSKRWKSGKLAKKIPNNDRDIILEVERIEKLQDHSLIRFEWQPPELPFSQILSLAGITPLPPYISREAIDADADRYQTIYARHAGSVAAPTAGLHFTDNVLHALVNKKITTEQVVLHVGAGTFKPVGSERITDHEMHHERIIIKKSTVESILRNLNDQVIAVGTTTVRTIESLYWFGVKLIRDHDLTTEICIKQWDPYHPVYNCEIPVIESLGTVLHFMEKHSFDQISGETQLMIVPGYRFRIPNVLITNFHLPKSTLLLLVSAFIGSDWKKVYDYALDHQFRFLSYGDACLFYKH